MKNTIKNIYDHKITRRAKIVIRWKLSILALLFLPLAIFTLLTAKTKIVPNLQSFVVLTGSMNPTLPVGSVVYVQRTNTLSAGDIISFTNNGQTITHRVKDVVSTKEGLAYQTKGDANNTPDQSLVASANVKGKVIMSLPYLGYFINALRTPLGFLLFVIGPILIFIALELWSIKGEIEKSIEKKLRQELSLNKYEKIDIS